MNEPLIYKIKNSTFAFDCKSGTKFLNQNVNYKREFYMNTKERLYSAQSTAATAFVHVEKPYVE